MEPVLNSNHFIILGTLFLFFAFFNKHAISILGIFLIYIGVNKCHLTNTYLYLLIFWIILSILYDYRFTFGVNGNFMLY